jgi:GTP-binding protein EngB required for normal cell division
VRFVGIISRGAVSCCGRNAISLETTLGKSIGSCNFAMFNESHQRHLITSFRHIEDLLGEAAAKLESPDGGRLFKEYVPDATAAQRKVLADYLSQFRFAVRRFMDAHGLRSQGKTVSAWYAFQTALMFAQIAVEELRPKYLRGYGALDRDDAAAAEQLVAELTTLLRRIGDYVEHGEGGDLAARLAQLDATDDTVSLLKELERVITAHGLVELRSSLQNLIERATSPRFEIAVFGRVNSGKSSLLNWWLETPLLPTGVTPVTAVPTRIVHGEVAKVRIRTAYSQPVTVDVDQLAAYVTEDGNPGNTKRVLDVLIEIPAARLKDGICLVDTPGLGSLATAGAAQTLDYLPRCDLAIMLIESGGVIRREDVDVARAVLDSGSELIIVLSKADQVSDADLPRALTYVTEQFRTNLGVPVSISPVSTVEEHVALAQAWFERELTPRLANHRAQSAAALRRKTGALREAVVAVLEARLASRSRTSPQPGQAALDSSALGMRTAARSPAAGAGLPRARADIESARRDLMDLGSYLRKFSGRLLEVAADELARCWGEEAPDQVTAERVNAAIARTAGDAGEAASTLLGDVRKRMEQVLTENGVDADASQSLPVPRGRPLFEAPTIADRTLARPRWTPGIARLLRALAHERLESALASALSDRLALHGEALRSWGVTHLEELSSHFENAIAPIESAERACTTMSPASQDTASVHRDLEILRQWSRSSAGERASA